MTEIIPGLFLGCLAEAAQVGASVGRRWYVLNCSGESIKGTSAAGEILEIDLFAASDRIKIRRRTVRTALAFIDAKRRQGSVLVCCHSGRSRSAGLVVAYLVHTGMSREDAEGKVLSVRPEVEISDFIRRELQKILPGISE